MKSNPKSWGGERVKTTTFWKCNQIYISFGCFYSPENLNIHFVPWRQTVAERKDRNKRMKLLEVKFKDKNSGERKIIRRMSVHTLSPHLTRRIKNTANNVFHLRQNSGFKFAASVLLQIPSFFFWKRGKSDKWWWCFEKIENTLFRKTFTC